jgi:hypothetical protein
MDIDARGASFRSETPHLGAVEAEFGLRGGTGRNARRRSRRWSF